MIASVIILNYFGEKVLKQAVESVLSSDLPKHEYEIIIVDNNSRDRSRSLIDKLQQENANVISIFLRNNLGFAAGNNRGVEVAKGDYVILLNNDCLVGTNWISELVKTAEKDKNIFAVNSKILLFPKYLSIKLKMHDNFCPTSLVVSQTKLLKYSGRTSIKIPYKLNKEYMVIDVPFCQDDEQIKFSLTLRSMAGEKTTTIKPKVLNLPSETYSISTSAYKKSIEIELVLKPNHDKLSGSSFCKLQNAGIMVFDNGYGRDIGASVRYQTQDYEKDNDHFEIEKEVYAACGAAVLYRTSILRELGMLNESFFMYYEDVDISERARLHGYKIMYSPKAIVHHLHALSSKEWSPFFIYHVEKGRLMHVFFNFPLRVFFREYALFGAKSLVKFINSVLKLRSDSIGLMQAKLTIEICINLLQLYSTRLKQLSNVSKGSVLENYEKIKSAYWYSN